MTTHENPTKRFFFPPATGGEKRHLFFPLPNQQQNCQEKTAAFLAEGLGKPHKLVKKLKALVLAQTCE